jgi:glycosyltransferase involved in cell wall biosynthesis
VKLALLSYEYPPETGFGGIGSYAWYQARALARLGHEVHVLAGAVDATPLRATEHDGVTVHRYRAAGRVMRAFGGLGSRRMWWTRNRLETAWSMLHGLRRLEREHRFDAIEMPECGGEGLLVNRWTRARTLVRFHSPAALIMPFYDVVPSDVRWCSRVERAAMNAADAFTSCSRFLAEEVRDKLGIRRPVSVIHNGIDVGLFDAADQVDFRARFGLPADRPLVFFSGRMEPRKGVHLLPEIAGALLERHEVALVLAGDDLFHHVRDTVLPALEGRRLRGSIHPLGRITPVEIRSGLCQSEVFLLPSVWENCPYACLEAMAAGRAIVATDHGGLPELIEDGVNGLLARSGDAASYVTQLDRVITDAALRRRLGTAARTTVLERFTDHQVAEESVRQYQAVGSGRN